MKKLINIEPTWRGVLPALLHVWKDGSDKGRAEALAELQRMADAADLWNAGQKKDGEQ